MKLRDLIFCILLPTLVIAGHFGGDTVITSLSKPAWIVDGNRLGLYNPDSMCLCEEGGFRELLRSPGTFSALSPKSKDTNLVVSGTMPNFVTNPTLPTEIHFNDGAWWKVQGKKDSWAMEIDSLFFQKYYNRQDTLAFHVHWAKFDAKRPWVQWIDSVNFPRGSKQDSIVTQQSHLVRCLADTSCTIDSLSAHLSIPSGYGISGISLRLGLFLAGGLATDTLWAKFSVASNRFTYPAPIAKRNLTNTSSLSIQSLYSWTGSYLMPSLPSGWQKASATWKFRISGITDSIVQTAWLPTFWEGLAPKGHGSMDSPQSRHAVDLQGRSVVLSQPLPLGANLVRRDGRLQTVVVEP